MTGVLRATELRGWLRASAQQPVQMEMLWTIRSMSRHISHMNLSQPVTFCSHLQVISGNKIAVFFCLYSDIIHLTVKTRVYFSSLAIHIN